MSVYDVVLQNIFEAMERGIVPWKSPYLFEGHKNIDGRIYKGINIFLLNIALETHGYEIPIWLTFNQIKNRGWHLKKGSKSTIVTFFKQEEREITEVNEYGEEETVVDTIRVLRYYRVFNIQCVKEYDEIKSKYEYSIPKTQNNLIKNYITNSGVKLIHEKQGISRYIPSKDTIVMTPTKKGEYYSVLTHEIVHSTGHKTRLNRFSDFIDNKGYSFEELVAEIGSAYLLSKMGMKPNYQNVVAYLEGWSRWLSDQKKTTIFKAAKESEKAVEFIESIANIEKEKIA